MTDWKQMARALDPPIPDSDIEEIVPVLDALEAAFKPLQRALPPETGVWTALQDSE